MGEIIIGRSLPSLACSSLLSSTLHLVCQCCHYRVLVTRNRIRVNHCLRRHAWQPRAFAANAWPTPRECVPHHENKPQGGFVSVATVTAVGIRGHRWGQVPRSVDPVRRRVQRVRRFPNASNVCDSVNGRRVSRRWSADRRRKLRTSGCALVREKTSSCGARGSWLAVCRHHPAGQRR